MIWVVLLLIWSAGWLGWFMGKRQGWGMACSECLGSFASAMRTTQEAIKHQKELSVEIDQHRAIQSLAGEYQEELAMRGIWRREVVKHDL